MRWSPRDVTPGIPQLCVGIDPHPETLELWGCDDSARGLAHFATRLTPLILESTVSVVKPQVAFFERHGVAGMTTLADLLAALRSRDVGVIGDAKRGDIPSTMQAYAQAWLMPGSDFEVDAVTVVPYQGVGALEPALELAHLHGKGVFVLAATSNPEALNTQSARRSDGVSVARGVLEELQEWCAMHPGSELSHGVVLGATVSVSDVDLDLGDFPGTPLLVPGFGHQGASLRDIPSLFPATSPVIAVVARSVLGGGPEGFLPAVQVAVSECSP